MVLQFVILIGWFLSVVSNNQNPYGNYPQQTFPQDQYNQQQNQQSQQRPPQPTQFNQYNQLPPNQNRNYGQLTPYGKGSLNELNILILITRYFILKLGPPPPQQQNEGGGLFSKYTYFN